MLQASPVATAPFAGAGHEAPAGTIRAGTGSILAVPSGYLEHLETFRLLHGAMRQGQVVLDQQLAATLQARVGDTITLTPSPRAKPTPYPRQRRRARDGAGRPLPAAQPATRACAGPTAGPDRDHARSIPSREATRRAFAS